MLLYNNGQVRAYGRSYARPLDKRTNLFIKRATDVLGSLVILALTSPLMLMAAVGVRLSSQGPVLFKQERVGRLGKRFTILKFRSMRQNSSSEQAWTRAADPRRTAFGRFLRATSIDELPQLINVLRGDMSLVGPRPEIPHFVDKFEKTVPNYSARHAIRPGITGLAQVRGLRGDTSLERRVESDIEYMRRWSIWLDLYLIFITPFRAFNRQERRAPRHRDKAVRTYAADTAVGELPRKILYAASTAEHLERFHKRYIDALRSEGCEVLTLARGEGVDFDIPFEKRIFSRKNLALRKRIRRLLRDERPDIVFLNTSLAAYHIRMCLRRRSRPRVVNMVHGYLFSSDPLRRAPMLGVEKHLASRTDAIIAMNREDADVARRYKLCTGEVYLTRGTGARVKEAELSADEIRRELRAEERFVLCFVGELSQRKNQALLIKALARLKKYIPSAALWLVGEGNMKEALERLAERLGVSNSVLLLGERRNACDYMRASDVYVSASLVEGMPHNIIEAMGCGCTVVASDIKGHKDIIEQGKSGFLYTADNIGELVDCIRLIRSGALKAVRKNILSRYERFSESAVFDNTYNIIKRSFVNKGGQNGDA